MHSLPLSRRLPTLTVAGMAASGLLAVIIGFAGDWNWFADLFAQLRPQYCLWLGLAWFGSLWLRQRLSLLLATIGLVLNSVALAPYAHSWHEPAKSQLAGRTWTLASINLLQGNQETALVRRYLRDTQPDIVVFQEVSARWAAALEPLSDLYPYRFVQPSKDQFGLALFSREKPIVQSVHAVGDRVGDLAIFGTWESDGRRFSIAGIHPDKPDERWKTVNRANYLGRIAQWAEERAKNGEAVVVIGDFNATPWSASVRAFVRRTGLRNANDGRIFRALGTFGNRIVSSSTTPFFPATGRSENAVSGLQSVPTTARSLCESPCTSSASAASLAGNESTRQDRRSCARPDDGALLC